MKIVHVGPSSLPILFARGGAIERRMIEMASVQAEQGHDVTVYSAEAITGETWHRGVRMRAIRSWSSGWFRSLHFLWRAGRELQDNPVDVIHFHSMPEGIWFTGKATAVKLLSYDYFHSRRWDHRPFYNLYRRTLQRYHRLLPVSEYCLEASRRFWRIAPEHFHVLYNGVNTEQFSPDPASAAAMKLRLGLPVGPIVLYVGRVCEQKGTDVLTSAFERLKSRMPEVQLVVAGPAEHFGNRKDSALVHRVAEVGGHYLGTVDECDLAATYNLATVYVMATKRDEMFGMAALEAQASGKPVICSRQGGLPEVVSLTSGMHFPVGDAAELAERLLQLLSQPKLYEAMAVASRQNAFKFAWPAIVEDCFQIYATTMTEDCDLSYNNSRGNDKDTK